MLYIEKGRVPIELKGVMQLSIRR